MKRLKILLLLVVSVVVPAMANDAEPERFPAIFNGINKQEMNEWVDSVMSTMTIDEKIGQLIVIQVPPSTSKNNLAWIRKMVTSYHIGGLLYTRGNLPEQARVTNHAQSAAKIPLMITIDGEWGLSMRFKDAPDYPRNMVLGAITDDRVLYEYGNEIARQCRRAGIHVNFAPVLDVNDNPSNPVIGSRSFGEDPYLVSRHGIAYAKGLEDGDVLSVAKHFPGHGNSSQDSHKTLPVINKNMSELKICEFVPFRQYIDAGLSGMLTAHLSVPAIFNGQEPSSLSKAVVTDLLQEEMGFNGLIFTDGLAMKGVTRESEICVKALLAGNDVLLGPVNPTGEFASIKNAVEAGRLSRQLIDERCRKVLQYKYALGLYRPQHVDVSGIAADINSSQAGAVCHKLWAKAMTVLKNDGMVLPVSDLDTTRIAVLTIGSKSGLNTMFQNRCRMYSNTKRFNYSDGMSIEKLSKELSGYDVVIAAVHSSESKYAAVLDQITQNVTRAKVVSVMFTSAYNTSRFAAALGRSAAVVMAYDNCELAQDYAAQTVYGGNAASGKLPVSINGVASAGTGIETAKVRLGYGTPEEEGMKGDMVSRIDSLIRVGLASKAFPGCQVLVARNGMVVCNKAYGAYDYDSGRRVTVNTLYDLASVTKATGTIAGIMKAYDDGLIDVDAHVGSYIPQLKGTGKENITIRQLLYHESGMPPSLNMYDVLIDTTSYDGRLFSRKSSDVYSIKVARNLYGNNEARVRTDIVSDKRNRKFNLAIADGVYGSRSTYDTIMRRIYNMPLCKDNKYRYSCLNFCLLMKAEENVARMRHNVYVDSNMFAPLGAWHTLYRPLTRFGKSDIAPTEYDPMLRHGLVHGYVHDETAAYSGGVQGNAGLFSNANDLAKLFQMWLNGGVYGGHRYLKPSTVLLFCKDKSPNSRRGLGFDKPDMEEPEKSPTCSEATAATFGHIGFTGTCYWVDPDNGLIFIFLCNRVNPTRDNRAFAKLDIRPKLYSIVCQSIDKLPQ